MPDADKMLDYLNKKGIRSAVSDNPKADIEGSSQVGIYPVLYDNDTEKEYKKYLDDKTLQCEYLHIHEWKELVDALEQLS